MTPPLDAAGAALLLGVSKRALYNLLAPNGPIPCSRPTPRRVEIRREDLLAYKETVRALPVASTPEVVDAALDEAQLSAIDAAWWIAKRVAVSRIVSKPENTIALADLASDDAELLFHADPPMPRPDEAGRFSVEVLAQWIASWAKVERRDAPTTLYRHFDEHGRLLYVGVSFNVLLRTRQHQLASSWFGQVAHVETEEFLDRRSALATETRAIRTEHPLHNIRR